MQFNVLTTTNLSLPTSEWTVLGPASEGPPGQFQFTDVTSTNYAQRKSIAFTYNDPVIFAVHQFASLKSSGGTRYQTAGDRL